MARFVSGVTARTLLCLTTLVAPPAGAQRGTPPAVWDEPRMALHTMLGAFVPLGARRDALGSAAWIGLQGVSRLRPWLALTGGIAVAQTSDRRSIAPRTDLALWQYDVGVESAPWTSVSPKRRTTVFGGVGVGVRTYDYRGREPPRRSALAGYVSAGLERRPALGSRTGVRAEWRTYLVRAAGNAAPGRGVDGVLALGLTHHFQ